MKKLEFSIEINASKEKVWEALWKAENYAEWTKVFCEVFYPHFFRPQLVVS